MGLLDSLANEALSALSSAGNGAAGAGDAGASAASTASAHPGMMDVVTSLLGNQSSIGGIAGLLSTCQRLGLGEIVNSWVSTGHNLPISADQLQSLLGSEQMASIAQRLGLSLPDAAQALAHVLPQAVNHVTPDGEVPHNDLVEQGLAMFRSFSAARA